MDQVLQEYKYRRNGFLDPKKSDPALELLERAGKYGGNELHQAADALDKAQEELKEVQSMARREEKEEAEARLKEKAAENAAERKAQNAANKEGTGNLKKASANSGDHTGTRATGSVADGCNYDTVEISRDPFQTLERMPAADIVPEFWDAGKSHGIDHSVFPGGNPKHGFPAQNGFEGMSNFQSLSEQKRRPELFLRFMAYVFKDAHTDRVGHLYRFFPELSYSRSSFLSIIRIIKSTEPWMP